MCSTYLDFLAAAAQPQLQRGFVVVVVQASRQKDQRLISS